MSSRRGKAPSGARSPAGSERALGAGGRGARPPRHAVPLLERIVGGLGAVLVGGAVAFLLYHSLNRDQTPPDVRVATQRVLELPNGYLVQFRASNQGSSAAAQLTIEGELTGADGQTETSEATLDYLPPRSEREGGLIFARDPRAGQLALRAKAYAKP
jgi:uncharacterized protein (TIGR02588 family)